MSRLTKIKAALDVQPNQDDARLIRWLLSITTDGYTFRNFVRTEIVGSAGKYTRRYHARDKLKAIAKGIQG